MILHRIAQNAGKIALFLFVTPLSSMKRVVFPIRFATILSEFDGEEDIGVIGDLFIELADEIALGRKPQQMRHFAQCAPPQTNPSLRRCAH
jgi:hypothetical protein